MQELGIESGNLLGIDFAAAIREGNRNNGLGTIQGRGRGNQTVKDTSDDAGREDKGKEHPKWELKILEDEFKETDNPRDFVRRAIEAWDNEQRRLESNPTYIRERNQYDKNDSKNRRQSRRRRKDGLERSSKDGNSNQETEPIAFLDSTTSQRESQQTSSDVSSQEYQRRSTRLSRYHKDNVSWIRK